MTVSMGRQLASMRRLGHKLSSAEDGATAVEFGLICVPFFMLLFGILGICQLFFWTFTTENAVWAASRDMRTGAFQTTATGSPYAGLSGDTLKTAFRQQICNGTISPTDCFANSVVLVQSTTLFGGITQPACADSSNALVSNANAMAAFNAGATSSIVMVTLCYSWKYGTKLPYLPVKTLNGGGYLIQASAAFKTEPY